MIRPSLVLIFSLFAFLPLTGSAAKTSQDPKAVATLPVANPDPVVAKVLGESITEKQVLDVINQLARNPQADPQMVQQKNTAFYKDALDTLIGGILLRNEAKEKNIVADKAKVEETFKSVKGQFQTEDAYQKALLQQGLTEAALRNSIESNVIYQQVLDMVVKDVPAATDAEIQKFYDDNPKYFEEPEQVHAAHIFLKVDKTASPEQKAEARRKLEGIRADIERQKITFAEAATKNSDDKSSAANSGDLGFFARGQMLPALEDAAFAAKPGTLTPIVESEYGFHLIKVIEVKPAGKTPLDKVKPDIKSYLERKAKQDASKKHIAALKENVPVETVMTDAEWNKRNAGK